MQNVDFQMTTSLNNFVTALKKVSKIFTSGGGRGAMLVKKVPETGKPGIVGWNNGTETSFTLDNAQVDGSCDAILIYLPGDRRDYMTTGMSLSAIADQIEYDTAKKITITCADGRMSFDGLQHIFNFSTDYKSVATVGDFYRGVFKNVQNDANLKTTVAFTGVRGKEFGQFKKQAKELSKSVKTVVLRYCDAALNLSMGGKNEGMEMPIGFGTVSVDDSFKATADFTDLCRAYMPGKQTVIVDECESEKAAYGLMTFVGNVDKIGTQITSIQLKPDFEETANSESEEKKMSSRKNTTGEWVRKPVAANRVKKDSGWSVAIVPALVPVKQIKALAGLRVRPIRDERHHKVGYVGRGKNGKTVLVWRDWYVQRTTDEARKALLKRAKVAA